jgi:TatD DNase family protein
MELVDTHCHIHIADYKLDANEVIKRAKNIGVSRLICVGCTLEDSQAGVEFVQDQAGAWAAIGLHPHEAHHYIDDVDALTLFKALATQPKVVAIGECGLDYYYNHSPKEAQIKLLRFQLDLAQEYNLPMIFHVRDAFDDFWRVFDDYKNIRGVVHSFTAGKKELDQVLERGLHVGLNGIMTFTKNPDQLETAKLVPSDKLVLETDAPFLTPSPYRGTICEPKHVRVTAEFLANLRGETLETLALTTTNNAIRLFNLE